MADKVIVIQDDNKKILVINDVITQVVTEDRVKIITLPQGARGLQGLSAYEIAVNNGFVGTEQEWLDSLVGGGAIYFEQLNGDVDNSNKIFTTTYDYVGNSTAVFINGLKQKLNEGYFENGLNEIEFSEAPSDIGFIDDLFIIYKKGT